MRYKSCKDRVSCKNKFWQDIIEGIGLELTDIPDMEEECWNLFQELKKRKHDTLIIDLRNNEGGNSTVGQVYVLIDQGVFSSGEWLAAELYANSLGTFIGEPTGGGGTVPGDQINFELPNTKLQLVTSYKLFIPPAKQNLRGVIPHTLKRQNLSDYREKRDTVLEYVKDRIRVKRGCKN